MALAKLSKPQMVVLCLVLFALVGVVDWSLREGFTRSIFYLIPICLGTWYAGRSFGLSLAAATAAVRFVAHFTGNLGLHWGLPSELWNDFVGLVAFSVVVVLLSQMRTMSDLLEKKVDERTARLMEEVVERKRAEEAIRLLSGRLSEAEETERTRLASDLHDSIGQLLSLLKLNLGTVAERLGDDGTPPPDLLEALHLIDDIIKQVRTFTFKIHPAMLEDLGLIPTLHWYAEQFETHAGTQVTVTESGERKLLSPSVRPYLFRAIKELVNNAAKHGRAKEVVIATHWRPDGMRIVIDDDGSGFDPVQALAPQNRHGLGLAGIQERLRTLNGHLEIESEPGHGTRVMMEIALQSEQPIDVLTEVT